MARQMKDSGIEWIGEIPEEWNLRRLRFLCDITTGNQDTQDNDPDGEYPFYVRSPIVERSCRYTFEGPAILMAGDGVGAGKVFHDVDGKYGCHQRVYSMQHIRDVYRRFLFYYLQNRFFISIETANSKSTVDSVRLPMLQDFPVTMPSFEEQKAIADFLDHKCAEIDAVIERTKATIEEYKKLKQAVITEAVTKGVRGVRKMKDSGIEWVEGIIDSWDMSRIGLHYNIVLGKMLCDKQLTEEHTLESYFCAANVHFDGISQEQLKQMWFSPAEKVSYRVQEGDLLVVEGGAGAGGAAIVEKLEQPTYVQNSVMIVRGLMGQSNHYLRYWIECLVKKGYVDVVCNKATIPHFTKDKLATMPVPVIPVEEMEEIADYLDEKCAALDTLIAKKTALLTEMETYKKSLIYEVVTGKKEV